MLHDMAADLRAASALEESDTSEATVVWHLSSDRGAGHAGDPPRQALFGTCIPPEDFLHLEENAALAPFGHAFP